jgi:putative YhdH/YhfP family quinone oxidoreductase
MEQTKLFRALVAEETSSNGFTRSLKNLSITDLPDGDVLIRVSYSSLNYKDALSAAGNRGITRSYPHTPGVDAAGIVVASTSGRFSEGDAVIVNGYDLGMNTPGGFGRFIRVPADWVLRLPHGLSMKESMIYGTAGFTAAMALEALHETVRPGDGDILVTGASGGVGCLSVALLADQGYRVVAVSGKPESWDFLSGMGASERLSREEAVDLSGRPLLKGRWAGVIDNVGGDILAAAIRSAKPGGSVICCGNVSSAELSITVYPFILRGIRLVGIDSQNCPMEHREQIWKLLAGDWKSGWLEQMYREISLDQLGTYIDLMLEGKVTGRVVIKHDW